MTWAAVLGAVSLAAPSSAASAEVCAAPAAPPPMPADMVAEAAKPHPYPTFCSIPPVPHDVRSAMAWKAAVVDTRVAGARLKQESGPSTFSLDATSDFAGDARSEAAPPPPMTSPDDTTEAFVKGAKSRATPPPRPH